jgi:MYXO-CTERM domain-containing protein
MLALALLVFAADAAPSWTGQVLTAPDGRDEDRFGAAVAGAGDLDGDGYGDAAVAAPDADTNAGAVYVFYGGEDGLDALDPARLSASDAGANDYFGTSVAAAGDVNGDGYGDLLVGAPYADDGSTQSGVLYVYYGRSVGVGSGSEAIVTASDRGYLDHFGVSVAGAGDLNADGAADLLVGAWQARDGSEEKGAAYVFYGQCEARTWYADLDGDGYGDPGASVEACAAPERYVADDTDCDDGEPLAWGGAEEVCDGVDTAVSGEEVGGDKGGCGCASGPAAGWLWVLALAALRRRRSL